MHRQRASERQAFDCGQHLGQGQRLVQDHGAHRGIAQARGVHRQGRKRKPHRRGTGQQRRVVGAQRRLSAKGEKISNKTHRSKVDPDSRIARKGNFSETYLGHGVSYVMDNKSRVIVGADQNLPNRNADAVAGIKLVSRLKWAYKLKPRTLGADKGMPPGNLSTGCQSRKSLRMYQSWIIAGAMKTGSTLSSSFITMPRRINLSVLRVRGFGTGEFTNTVGSMSIGQVLRTVGSVL